MGIRQWLPVLGIGGVLGKGKLARGGGKREEGQSSRRRARAPAAALRAWAAPGSPRRGQGRFGTPLEFWPGCLPPTPLRAKACQGLETATGTDGSALVGRLETQVSFHHSAPSLQFLSGGHAQAKGVGGHLVQMFWYQPRTDQICFCSGVYQHTQPALGLVRKPHGQAQD